MLYAFTKQDAGYVSTRFHNKYFHIEGESQVDEYIIVVWNHRISLHFKKCLFTNKGHEKHNYCSTHGVNNFIQNNVVTMVTWTQSNRYFVGYNLLYLFLKKTAIKNHCYLLRKQILIFCGDSNISNFANHNKYFMKLSLLSAGKPTLNGVILNPNLKS